MSVSDVHIFGRRCADIGVSDAAVVMVAGRQPSLDSAALAAWASQFGIGLTLFHGWPSFVDQALFWSSLPKPVAAIRAVDFIHGRLKAVEASSKAVSLWHALVKADAIKGRT